MLKKLYITLEKLENEEKFKVFKKEHSKAYFASAFFMTGDGNWEEANWQLDFFLPEKHTMTSFVFKENNLEVIKGQNIFQKEKVILNLLDLDEVKIDFEIIINKVKALQNKVYPGESTNKIIVLLQKQEKLIWNITLLTESFKVWNVKVDAQSGEILTEKMESVLSFKSQ